MQRLTIHLLLIFVFFLSKISTAQNNSCGLSINNQLQKTIDNAWSQFVKTATLRQQNEDTLILPVVFHIIHQNGGENLSDQNVLNALQNLNDGFANRASYDQGSGIDTRIQFCLAKVDPEGNSTTGINHVYADLPKVIPEIHDQFLKSLIIWDPTRYINIWVVKKVQMFIEFDQCENPDLEVAGYATLPDAHGSSADGIVMEANALKDAIVHEMGHYLGLYHTFHKGCANNDCSADGDLICDTPPQLKYGASCNGSSNTCKTDSLSGFATDQNDLPFNFMDYTSCMHNFTEGQKQRMRFIILNVRNSLLNQLSCEAICVQPTKAEFTFPYINYKTGDSVLFTNTSAGSAYEWEINDAFMASTADLAYQFTRQGWHKVELLSKSTPDVTACRNVQTNYVKVYCAVKPKISLDKLKVTVEEEVRFSSSITIIRNSNDAESFAWYYNDTLFSTAQNPMWKFSSPGNKVIYLVVKKGTCTDTSNYEMAYVKELPDYTFKINGVKCDASGKQTLNFSICNEGYFNLPAGLPVTFYNRNPTTVNAQIVTTFSTNKAVGRLCCETFDVELPPNIMVPDTLIYGVVNDNGSLPRPYSFNLFPVTIFKERKYENNLDSFKLDVFRLNISPKDTTVLIDNSIQFTSTSNHAYTIKWMAAKGDFSCDTCPVSNFLATGYSRVIATAMNNLGCIDRDTALVKVFINQDILIPSAFTPNRDGMNDVFYILGRKRVSKINSFRIYNRWGEKVFERNNFPPNDPYFGWDGMYKGKQAALAAYVYYFSVDLENGVKKEYKGTVVLIR